MAHRFEYSPRSTASRAVFTDSVSQSVSYFLGQNGAKIEHYSVGELITKNTNRRTQGNVNKAVEMLDLGGALLDIFLTYTCVSYSYVLFIAKIS